MSFTCAKKLVEKLSRLHSHQSFVQSRLDHIRLLSLVKRTEYAIVAIKYYTNLMEIHPINKIQENQVIDFIWKHINYRFGLSYTLVLDNGTQFIGTKFKKMFRQYDISHVFSIVEQPQANERVVTTNKTIKLNLKRYFEKCKTTCVEKLPKVLQTCRTTFKTMTSETPYS